VDPPGRSFQLGLVEISCYARQEAVGQTAAIARAPAAALAPTPFSQYWTASSVPQSSAQYVLVGSQASGRAESGLSLLSGPQQTLKNFVWCMFCRQYSLETFDTRESRLLTLQSSAM